MLKKTILKINVLREHQKGEVVSSIYEIQFTDGSTLAMTEDQVTEIRKAAGREGNQRYIENLIKNGYEIK